MIVDIQMILTLIIIVVLLLSINIIIITILLAISPGSMPPAPWPYLTTEPPVEDFVKVAPCDGSLRVHPRKKKVLPITPLGFFGSVSP